jgi:hypothetical protein
VANASLKVFCVQNLQTECGSAPGGWTPTDYSGVCLPVSYIQDDHPGSPAYIATHEIGHALGNFGHTPTNDLRYTKYLMWPHARDDEPCRLNRDEWRQFNTRARDLP